MPELPFKNTQEFCQYVRKEAKQKGLKITHLLDEPGLDRSNFSKYESGRCRVSLETALLYLDVLRNI
ncbi:MAG: helix-turn-helix transcriptional regulator [Oligoflexales bacterium]|nr:helix-turn-helix transcriptional regulator [Oligoflexales bacterium]